MKLPFYRVEVYGQGINAFGDSTSGPLSFLTVRIVFAFCKERAIDKVLSEVRCAPQVVEMTSSSPLMKTYPGEVQHLGLIDFLKSRSTGLIFFHPDQGG